MFILPDHRPVADSELVVEVGVLEREAAGSATVLGLDVAEAPGDGLELHWVKPMTTVATTPKTPAIPLTIPQNSDRR